MGPRAPAPTNHLKDLIMLRRLDWGSIKDRHCPGFFLTLYISFNVNLQNVNNAEFVVYMVKEKDQTLDVLE